jgi:hypothetical protein
VMRAMDQGKTATLTVVPVITSSTDKVTGNVLKFDEVVIVTYR